MQRRDILNAGRAAVAPVDGFPLQCTRGRWFSLLVAAIGFPLSGHAGLTAEVHKQTYTYKTVGTLPIKADVFRADDQADRPVVVWIHGGALINGHRESIPSRLRDPLLEAGCILVSIDYRLAPETNLSGIIEDIEDAFRWIQKDGPRLFHADARRVAVIGGSAGGYLTLTTGFRVTPRPAALVALWGYGDLVGPWYSTPSPHPRHQTVKLSRDEAFQQVAGPPIADSRDRKGNGGAFYQFCRQQGLWPKAVSGWDPLTETEKFVPYMPVRNVDSNFPPTLLIHGEDDTDVPCEQSVMMAAALRKNNVEHRLLTLPGAEHGLAGAEAAKVEEVYHAAVEFLTKHLSSTGTANKPKTVKIAGIVLKWIRTDKEANLCRAEAMIREAAARGAQIVCTTECFLDGYAIADKSIPLDQYRALGEPIPDGPCYKRLADLARELKILLVAGMLEADGEARCNTTVVISPEGRLLGKYRKQHLEHELARNRPGTESPVFDTPYGRIGVMICADRRLPEIAGRLKEQGADFFLCPSGGMFGPKSNDWILQARSRETHLPIIFVHPAEFLVTGPDGSVLGQTLLGNSLLIDTAEADTPKDQNEVFYFDLHSSEPHEDMP